MARTRRKRPLYAKRGRRYSMEGEPIQPFKKFDLKWEQGRDGIDLRGQRGNRRGDMKPIGYSDDMGPRVRDKHTKSSARQRGKKDLTTDD